MSSHFDYLSLQLPHCLLRERHRFQQQLVRLQGEEARKQLKPVELARLSAEIRRSCAIVAGRLARLPRPAYPEALPITAHKAEIAEAIRRHPVVVVCGETGSGKTTQLPKICLELGRGVAGIIGHTQPRRIAAQTVSQRLAHELGSPLGKEVGYKIRFWEKLETTCYVKIMTDGILLSEIPSDPWLEQYDTLILDEAHERSLNIDFLLGYLQRLLSRRGDLKLIVTSATIDPARFSKFFSDAPVIEVSGRAWPVEVRYRPPEEAVEEDAGKIPVRGGRSANVSRAAHLDSHRHAPKRARREGDGDTPEELSEEMQRAVVRGVEELFAAGPGDVLVFLSGEREILHTARTLRKRQFPGTEILPLYARLPAAEQQRVFSPPAGRRVVLATNVAETSLTVPGIRYVIDTGLARISRYSARSRVQRLPVEKISRASCDQRKGRCGRLGPGICLRLYDEEDYAERPAFTPPEITRANLAGVILQMKEMRLGEVADFPFLDPPGARQVMDGYELLREIGALDHHGDLTPVGRELARLPVDPRRGRILLEARRRGCLAEILILVAGLELPDPRLRPLENRQGADELHRRFHDEQSDFLGLIRLWDFYHREGRMLSWGGRRRFCEKNYLSFTRMQEWTDIHRQLGELVAAPQGPLPRRGAPPADPAAPSNKFQGLAGALAQASAAPSRKRSLTPRGLDQGRYDPIHRSLLAGFLRHVGWRTKEDDYLGSQSKKFLLFPGSGIFRREPAWVMAADLIETTRLYAHTVAAINPEWLEETAPPYLLKRTYSEAQWQEKTATVGAFEKVTLFGLPIIPRRLVHYGPIDPVVSREIFLRSALVEGQFRTAAPFFRENAKLIEEVTTLEEKSRRRDVLADEETRYAFYEARVPAGIYSGQLFEEWRQVAEKKQPRLLFLTRADLMRRRADEVTRELFPDHLVMDGIRFPLEYRFEPGHTQDGVLLPLPVAAINQVSPERLEWLVPGLLEKKVLALVKGLPDQYRRHLVPTATHAKAALRHLKFAEGSLLTQLSRELSLLAGIPVPVAAFNLAGLPDFLRIYFEVRDEQGKQLTGGRDLAGIRKQLGLQARESFSGLPSSPWIREKVTIWNFGDLPRKVEVKSGRATVFGFPSLVEEGSNVALRLFDSAASADREWRRGLRRLFLLQGARDLKYFARNLVGLPAMSAHYQPLGKHGDLEAELILLAADRAFLGEGCEIRTESAFHERLTKGLGRMGEAVNEVCLLLGSILEEFHRTRKLLAASAAPGNNPAIAEMKDHLARLCYKGFGGEVPWPWLQHYPRFLKGIALRRQKLAAGGLPRDQKNFTVLQPFLRQYLDLVKLGRSEPDDSEFCLYRWMLEEMRVSLFAQELKTSLPISTTRLEEQWKKIRDRG